jgi:hypothetical protein
MSTAPPRAGDLPSTERDPLGATVHSLSPTALSLYQLLSARISTANALAIANHRSVKRRHAAFLRFAEHFSETEFGEILNLLPVDGGDFHPSQETGTTSTRLATLRTSMPRSTRAKKPHKRSSCSSQLSHRSCSSSSVTEDEAVGADACYVR